MRAAPIGAFGAMAFTIGKYGIGSLDQPRRADRHLLPHLGAVRRARRAGRGRPGQRLLDLSADRLSARRSCCWCSAPPPPSAALPGLIEKLEAAGCARPVVGLVVPTGYSFNLDGTNIYMTLAALFIAQAIDVHLPIGDADHAAARRDAELEGRGGRDGGGLHHAGGDARGRAVGAGCGHGADPGHRPLHVEVPGLTNFIGNAVATIVVARWDNALDSGPAGRSAGDASATDGTGDRIARTGGGDTKRSKKKRDGESEDEDRKQDEGDGRRLDDRADDRPCRAGGGAGHTGNARAGRRVRPRPSRAKARPMSWSAGFAAAWRTR